MQGSQGLLLGMENKVLAEQGTPASDRPDTRFFPTGIHRSWLLKWIGLGAIAVLVLGVLWDFLFGH